MPGRPVSSYWKSQDYQTHMACCLQLLIFSESKVDPQSNFRVLPTSEGTRGLRTIGTWNVRLQWGGGEESLKTRTRKDLGLLQTCELRRPHEGNTWTDDYMVTDAVNGQAGVGIVREL